MTTTPAPCANAPLFAGLPGDIAFSFEFFPPKTEKMEAQLWDAIETLAPLGPRFVSVTYGAGGTTRERTHNTVSRLVRETDLVPAAHLTCVGASKAEIAEIAGQYWDAGVRHIVALRGDPPPADGGRFVPHPQGYASAAELVTRLKAQHDFEVSVAAYPEVHPEAASGAADLDNLKRKLDAGAAQAITQFFYSTDAYFRFLDKALAAGITAPILPGIMPVTSFEAIRRMSGNTEIPAWLEQTFEGLDDRPGPRALVAATVAVDLCQRLYQGGVRHFHFYTLNRAEQAYAICQLLGVRPKEALAKEIEHMSAEADFRAAAATRILVFDGGYGTAIQKFALKEADYRGDLDLAKDQKGNNDLLCLTRPDIIEGIHQAYFDAGADMVETNTFSSTKIAMADYGCEHLVWDINIAAAKLARSAAEKSQARDGRRRFVAGSIGPTNKTLSLSPDVNDPGFREVDYDSLKGEYREQCEALIAGGVDFLLIETCFDTLNAKAAGMAAREAEAASGREVPLMVSFTITDMSGRNLSGHTITAFWYAVRHLKPLTIGANCAFGADLLRPYLTELAKVSDTLILAYPNAGLPNELGEYDELPAKTAELIEQWTDGGLVNAVGGCCGTTPDHIAAIARAVAGARPRKVPALDPMTRLAGLEPFTMAA